MLLFVGVIVALIYFWFKKKFGFWSDHGFPAIKGKIPFGSGGGLGTKFHTSDVFKKFYDKYKEKAPAVGFYFFTKPVLLPTDPDLLKEIFVRNFDSFHDHGTYSNSKDDQLSDNIFFAHGSRWKSMKAKVSPAFTSGKMKMMFETVAEVCDGAVEFLKPTAEVSGIKEMKEVLASLTTEVIISVAFGLETKCLGNPTNEFRVIANKIFNPPARNGLKFAFMNAYPEVSEWLGLTINDTATIKFFTEMVAKTIKHREENKVMRNDFLQLLIQMQHEASPMTMSEIVANCYMFFLAGHETSSSTAMFALYELALNQNIQHRLRKEIFAVIAASNGEITYDGINEMKYLDMVFNETLRMFPVVDIQFRKCTSDFKIPKTEMIIPKDVSIMIPSYAFHRDERFFERPDEFDPERFAEENVKKILPYTYIPFSEGPRNCVGLRFGTMQTKITLVKLLQRFKFSACERTIIPMKFVPSSAFQTPVGGMWLKIENVE